MRDEHIYKKAIGVYMLFLLKKKFSYFYYTIITIPRAIKVILEIRKKFPLVFKSVENIGDTGFSHYGLLHSIIILAWSMRTFFWNHRYWPNLIEPKLMCEKLFTRKFSLRIEVPCIEDKIYADYFINQNYSIFNIKEIVWKDTDIDNLKTSEIPEGKYFLKLNKGSATSTRIDFPISNEKLDDIIREAKGYNRLNLSYRNGEWWNSLIKPCYFLEKKISSDDTGNNQIDDWKFFIINGKIELILLIANRFSKKNKVYFNRDLKLLFPNEYTLKTYQENIINRVLPNYIHEFEKIGKSYNFIRLDVYIKEDSRVYFGELTICSGSGAIPFFSKEIDKDLGDKYKYIHGDSLYKLQ